VQLARLIVERILNVMVTGEVGFCRQGGMVRCRAVHGDPYGKAAARPLSGPQHGGDHARADSESECSAHERGCLHGACQRSDGKFEQGGWHAVHSTRSADMPPEAHRPVLLRVMQEAIHGRSGRAQRRFQPTCASSRLTHRDLRRRSMQGLFARICSIVSETGVPMPAAAARAAGRHSEFATNTCGRRPPRAAVRRCCSPEAWRGEAKHRWPGATSELGQIWCAGCRRSIREGSAYETSMPNWARRGFRPRSRDPRSAMVDSSDDPWPTAVRPQHAGAVCRHHWRAALPPDGMSIVSFTRSAPTIVPGDWANARDNQLRVPRLRGSIHTLRQEDKGLGSPVVRTRSRFAEAG